MVDALPTVKGFLELESDFRRQAAIMRRHNPPKGSVPYEEAARLDALAERCREKAYDLLGVVTVSAKQLPLPLEVGR